MKTLLFTIFCSVAFLGNAQNYKTGIGLKGGFPYGGGLNVKHDFGGVFGDFTIGGGRNWISVSAIAEKQMSLEGQMEWYLGIGGYANFWESGYGYYKHDKYYNGNAFGVLGVIGLDYTFKAIPIDIAFEAGPNVNITPYVGFGFNTSFAIRYILK